MNLQPPLNIQIYVTKLQLHFVYTIFSMPFFLLNQLQNHIFASHALLLPILL